MKVQTILHMNEGVGKKSYANNSQIQRDVIMKVRPVLEESIREMYQVLSPKCLMMADMGCSTGHNSLLLVSEVINAVEDVCLSTKQQISKFGVFLNDLPGNDFNTLSEILPDFHDLLVRVGGKDNGPCFVSGTPGSFYGRLFPDQFLHFVHSSYGLHWLSQVPIGLETENGVPLNKDTIICLAKTSPPEVSKVYNEQFKRDFTLFLSSRGIEMVPGGRMVVTFLGRPDGEDQQSPFEIIGTILQAMVLEGKIEQKMLERFNIPVYFPTVEEVRKLAEEEGSFDINKLKSFSVDWSVNTNQTAYNRAKFVANSIRAVGEPLLVKAFGKAILNELFERFQANLQERMAMAKERTGHFNIVVSMTKRT